MEALASGRIHLSLWTSTGAPSYLAENLVFSVCASCGDPAVWLHDRLLWPHSGDTPPPNPDLSADVRRDYEEAGSILDLSPRGAAALLRLAIQKLCKELGGTGKDVDKDIGMLVARGLPVAVQQALDVVRVIGNEAVHPGELNLKDDRTTAASLFTLVNMIAEKMVTEPRAVAEMFDALPQGKRDHIGKRDGKEPRA
jgi:hypothetical protein